MWVPAVLPRAIAALAALVVLSACTPTPVSTPSGPSQPPSAPSPSLTGSPLPAQTTASAPQRSTTPTAVSQSTKPAVKLTEPARTSNIEVRLTAIRAIQSKGRGPGEVSGPALRVDVELINRSNRDFDTNSVLVTLLDSDSNPGGEMLGPPARQMRTVVKPGKSVKGIWVFNVAPADRKPVKILVTLPTNAPVLLFSGNAPS